MSNSKIKIAEPITLAAVAAGATIVSSAFTVIGFFKQRSENRRIIGLLSEVKTYVKEIDKKVNELTKQNKAILEKLDQLPSIIRRLLREETLNEKYSALDAIYNDYFLLPNGNNQYIVHSIGWQKLSEIITFIIKHEFRISKAPVILQTCEFTLIATRLATTPIIDNLLQNKIDSYNEIKEELYHNVVTSFQELNNTLSNSFFVKQHNLNEQILDISDLRYSMQPEKDINETYMSRERESRSGGGGGRDGNAEAPTYIYVPRTRISNEAIAYNSNKTIYDQNIKEKMVSFDEAVKNYRELRDIVKSFEYYLSIINDDYAKQASIIKIETIKDMGSAYFTIV